MPLGLLALFIQLFLPQCQLLLKFSRRLGGFGLLLFQRCFQAFLLPLGLLALFIQFFLPQCQLLLKFTRRLGGFRLLLRQLSGGRLFVLLITLARFIVGGLRRRQFLLPGVICLFRQRRQPLFQQGDTPIALLGLLFFLR